MDLQVLLKTLQRHLGKRHIDWPVSRQQHKLDWLPAARQRRDEIECGRVDPVKVFKYQNQRILRGYRFQGFADLPHHPFAGCSYNFSLQSFSLVSLDQRRKLNPPGWRSLGQNLGERIGAWIADQLA